MKEDEAVLKERVTDLKEESSQFEKDFDEEVQRVETLQDEMAELQKQMKEDEVAKQEMQEEIASLRERNAKEAKARKAQTQQITRLTATIESNKEDWVNEKGEYTTLIAEL